MIRRLRTAVAVAAAAATVGLAPAAAWAGKPEPAAFERATALAQPSLAYVEVRWTAYVHDTKTDELFGGANGYRVTTRCSGFVAGPEGVLATAGSCVDPSMGGAVGAQIAARAVEDLAKVGRAPDKAKALAKLTAQAELSGASTSSEPRLEVFVTIGATKSGVSAGAYEAEVVRFEPTGTAVLKVKAGRLPALELRTGASGGTKVEAVGFPGEAGAGATSADRSTVAGTLGGNGSGPLGATAAAGMVGGPVLDADGQVVGVLTAADQVAALTGLNSQLSQAGLKAALGPADRNLRAGLDRYFEGQYTDAIAFFDAVLKVLPDNEAAKAYKQKAAALRSSEGDATDWLSIGMYAAAAMALLVGILLLVLGIGKSGKAKREAAAQNAANMAPYSAVPMSGVPVSGYPVSGYPVSGYPMSAPPPGPPALGYQPAAPASMVTLEQPSFPAQRVPEAGGALRCARCGTGLSIGAATCPVCGSSVAS